MSGPSASARPLRILFVEDDENDALLIARRLEREGFAPAMERVFTSSAMQRVLERSSFDVVLSDFTMPGFDALKALRILRASGKDLPFIVVSGTIGEQVAVEAMRAGAHDYFSKSNLERLATAIEREMREARVRRERREALEGQVKLLEELRVAVRSRDEFLSMASHELRTPVTTLQLQLQSLHRLLDRTKGGVPRAVLERMQNLERQTSRIALLVGELLDLSRMRLGKIELKLEETDLAELARDTVEHLRTQAERAGCALSLRADAPAVGRWDRLRIEQVLTNLITNAIKFGEAKPIVVSIDGEDDRVRITVEDHGVGIAPEDQSRVFDRFERAAPAENYGGLGLGLYIARQIVEAHGGTIALRSTPGAGSTFTVELLRAPDDAVTRRGLASPGPPHGGYTGA